MESKEEILANLVHFNGTDQYHRHWLNHKYTDGIRYLCESCECYWLLDVIFSVQPYVRLEEFLVVNLTVSDSRGTVEIDNGNNRVLYRQEIPYTDFPLDHIKLYLLNGTVLILPSEY